MNGRAQYGELVRAAGQQILKASLALESESIRSLGEARSAASQYRDLLHALTRHGQELFGGDRNMWAVRAAVTPDPRDALAARLVDHLAHVGQRHLGEEPEGELALAWREAARAVRTVTDLLSTFHEPQGGWRTPEAQVLENPSVRAAGFGELASLCIPVAREASALGRRLEELGFDPQQIDDLVPETVHVREVALQMRDMANLSGFGRPLSTLEVARPPVRSDDPRRELGDRVARLHRVAWQLTKEDWVGICTLADLAVAGIAVHEAAAQHVRRSSASGEDGTVDLSARRALGRFEEGAGAWREVHAQLRQLRTATPVIEGLRADVVAVRTLLDNLADIETPATYSAVVSAATRFGEIAVWNLQTFEDQARKGRIYIPGRFLTGNQVSDEPLLVRAKLKGWLAPLQKEQAKSVLAGYQAVRQSATISPNELPLASRPATPGGPLRG